MTSKPAVGLSAWLLLAAPSAALAQNHTSVQGFGGVTFGTASSVVAGRTTAMSVGGVIATDLTDTMQIVGEAGRLSDIKAPLLGLLDFTPIDFRVSAWYGTGGVRFIASRHAAVRPYGEATAGFARVTADLSGYGDAAEAIVDAGVGLLNRTEPMLGAGGGVLFGGGPLAVDVGYRFKKIYSSSLASLVNGGNDYQVNEVRIAVGIRF
jgi:hypothetical protein